MGSETRSQVETQATEKNGCVSACKKIKSLNTEVFCGVFLPDMEGVDVRKRVPLEGLV